MSAATVRPVVVLADSDHDTAAAELVTLYDEKWAIIARNARLAEDNELRGVDVDDAFTADLVLDAACARFKAKFYPRRAGRVVVGLRTVFLLHKRGQVLIYDPDTSS